MEEDFPHGTLAGYHRHRSAGEEACVECKAGSAAWQRAWRAKQPPQPRAYVPSLPSIRRLQALAFLGWDMQSILESVGRGHMKRESMNHYMSHRQLEPATAQWIAEAFEVLCMKIPPRRNYATRIRNRARREGWAPPLAWDNIDDPNDVPQGMIETPEQSEA